MSKRLMRAILALAVVSLSIGVAMAGAQNSSNEFTATMKGSSESPKGPSRGLGDVQGRVQERPGLLHDVDQGRSARKPVAAHIHRGAAGANGPIVIDLKPTFKGTSPRVSKKCVTAPRRPRCAAIRRNPGRTSTRNVAHVRENPGGARPRPAQAPTRAATTAS